MKRATGRGSDQFNLRFPDGMRERISHEADKSGRSMNAEIIARLSFTLDGNLGDREELNRTIARYQKYLKEHTHQLVRVLTEKNSIAYALDNIKESNRQNIIFLETLCNFILNDPSSPDNLKRFARESLYSIEVHNEENEGSPSAHKMVDTDKELEEIILDIKENAEERAQNDPWAKAFGNNGFYTTVDISQRDERKIPDAPGADKPKRSKAKITRTEKP